jgi:ubiquitin carboxyl-terminal hydrolase 8
MNSTLQCLLHIPELNYFFINIYPDQIKNLKKINKDAETRGRLSEEYYKVVKGVCEEIITGNKKSKNYFFYEDDSFSPKNFNDLLSRLNPEFSKFEANDSKDLLLYLFQSMHAELNYLGDKKLKNIPKCNQLIESESFNCFFEVNSNLNLSILSYLFYGIIKSTTLCSSCKSKLYNFQFFQFLSFPVYNFKKKAFNIYQGFKEYVKPDNMTGDNQCYCQYCKGLKDAEVTSIIYCTPPYLIINFDYGKNKKYIPKKVEFGEIIDLTDFIDKECKEKTYELIAVSTHMGSSGSGGHYIAYCKNKQDNQWYRFNDSFVKKCKFEEVNSYSPYFLIFKKIQSQII